MCLSGESHLPDAARRQKVPLLRQVVHRAHKSSPPSNGRAANTWGCSPLAMLLDLPEPAAHDAEQLDGNVRRFPQRRTEIPDGNDDGAGCIHCRDRRGTRQVIKQRHLAENRAALVDTKVAHLARGTLLRNVYSAACDDEQAHASLILAHERSSGGIFALAAIRGENLKLAFGEVA